MLTIDTLTDGLQTIHFETADEADAQLYFEATIGYELALRNSLDTYAESTVRLTRGDDIVAEETIEAK